ncbi:ABC transporter ATP-binding protein [Candidatus Pelagibacter sp.]|nr:ABC transporter ATP-binding protein [Candidatus Pelagibacter sp.]
MLKNKNVFFKLTNNKKKTFFKLIFFYAFSSIIDILILATVSILATYLMGGNIEYIENKISPYISNKTNISLILGLILIFIYFIRTIFSYLVLRKIIEFSAENLEFLRNKIFNIYKKSYVELVENNSFEKQFNNVAYVVQVFSENVLQKVMLVVAEFIVFSIIVLYLLFVQTINTLIILFLLSLFYSLYYIFFKKKIKSAGLQQAKSIEKLIEIIGYTFKGIKEIKTLNISEYFNKRYTKYNSAFSKSYMIFQKIHIFPKYLLEIIVVSIIISFVLILNFLSDGDLDNHYPEIAVLIIAMTRLSPLVFTIFSNLVHIKTSAYSISELDKVFGKNKSDEEAHIEKNKLDINFKSLKLRNIYFSYKKRKTLFDNLNLEINKGDIIGIKGSSGSGKTTLVNIILGIVKYHKGEMIINNKFRAEETNFDKLTSYTPQDLFLINGSIEENIALGIEKNKIDKKMIREAIIKSGLKDFINKLPKKSKTLINSNILNISGGQAQRIAIARNFYYKKEINIFDEFTSALDEENEDKILKHLKLSKHTIIIISHKSSSLKYCDKIYNMIDGELQRV